MHHLILVRINRVSVLQANAKLVQRGRVLALESEVREMPGFYSHWGNIFLCFHIGKPQMPILALLQALCVCEKLDYIQC